MAAKEMYDYLTTVTADYSATTLSVAPHEVLSEMGGFSDIIFTSDDGTTEERIAISPVPYFNVTLIWRAVSDSDAGTIQDFYYDTAKAYGRTRTFKWQHPSDGHTYVARFLSETLERLLYPHAWHELPSVQLRVVGRIADA